MTGASGFLGRHVVAKLVAAGHEPLPVHLAAGVDFAGADAVIHCAAMCGGIGYNRANGYSLLMGNLELNRLVVEACIKSNTRMVALASVCAYPADAPLPFTESDLWNGYPEPTCAPYGIAKRVLVEQCRQAARYHGLSCTVLIPTNMYGPGDEYFDRSHVVPAIIRKMHEGADSVTIWGDGTPTRDLLYVQDSADACVRALTCPSFGPINLGTGVEISIRELVGVIAELVGFNGRIAWDSNQPNGQRRRRVNASRARALLGWSATTSLRDGLAATIADYRERVANG